jgi:hypothetical protein
MSDDFSSCSNKPGISSCTHREAGDEFFIDLSPVKFVLAALFA